MTAIRINELLVEFILPVTALVDAISKTPSVPPAWSEVPASPPASAALVIIEAMLYGINSEQTLHPYMPTWSALKGVLLRYTQLSLREFVAGSKIWSILTRMHELSFQLEGKELFLEQQKSTIDSSSILERASAVAAFQDSRDLASGFSESLGAYRYVMIICCYELDPSLESTARAMISKVHSSLIEYVDQNQALANHEREDDEAGKSLVERFRQSMITLSRFPQALL